MSNKSRPQWHEPVDSIIVEIVDPIEDTIEIGEVVLVDGPIDPVPLTTGSRTSRDEDYPRHSAGPMPDLMAAGQERIEKVKDAVQGVTEKAQDVTQKIAETASGAKAAAGEALETAKSAGADATGAARSAVSKVGTASTAGVKSAGAALWALIQRNPLQAIAVFASLTWLLRNNKTAAAQPPVSLSDAAEKVGSVAGHVQVAATNLRTQVQGQAQHSAGWFSDTLQANPLAIGAMAIVFGAGLGFAVPETPYEDNLLGKTRDELAGKAQEAAQDLGHKVQAVAQTAVHDALESGKEAAKQQGLTA